MHCLLLFLFWFSFNLLIICVVFFVSENYCYGKDEYTLHPYDCHNYIECSDSVDIRVRTCADDCPLISDGIVTCSTCTSNCS